MGAWNTINVTSFQAILNPMRTTRRDFVIRKNEASMVAGILDHNAKNVNRVVLKKPAVF